MVEKNIHPFNDLQNKTYLFFFFKTYLQSLQTPLGTGLDRPSGVKGHFQWNALLYVGHLKVLTFLCVLHNLWLNKRAIDNS